MTTSQRLNAHPEPVVPRVVVEDGIHVCARDAPASRSRRARWHGDARHKQQHDGIDRTSIQNGRVSAIARMKLAAPPWAIPRGQ
jgi:hypothetical protein